MTRSRITDITPSRLAQLNRGEAEASNLTECLAVDFAPDAVHPAFARAPGAGIDARRIRGGHYPAHGAGRQAAPDRERHEDLAALSRHPSASDTVRGWACFMVGASEGLSLSDRLALIRPLADDPHFWVRRVSLDRKCERPLLRSSGRPLPPWCPGRRSRPSDYDALPAKQPGPAASGVPILRPCDKHRSRP